MQILGWVLSTELGHPERAWQWIKYLAMDVSGDRIRIAGCPSASRQTAIRHSFLVPRRSKWEQVWIELISHPDTYVPRTLRDAMQGFIGGILGGQLEVGVGLERMHRTVSAVFAGKSCEIEVNTAPEALAAVIPVDFARGKGRDVAY